MLLLQITPKITPKTHDKCLTRVESCLHEAKENYCKTQPERHSSSAKKAFLQSWKATLSPSETSQSVSSQKGLGLYFVTKQKLP
ncbi:hypothetical protein K0M31_000012 [Melipona bicolor]|uniref:Uncharacterized protein n=1 Tax=Melipona bicolor TaxID=60889 RepID=A0AA40GDG5_9HYME|nr:hypothetical protein K0M31_000012 [Melipona bicolor]